jgi:CDGSH-type Zn-finger protein
MSTCTCGRTTRKPMCDGSHILSEEQYKERTERLNKLFEKSNKENNKDVKRTI